VDTPKYLRLAQELEKQIRTGSWNKGKVPSVRDIAQEHGVSVMTASRALQVLRGKGLVNTIERSGCFLTNPPEPEAGHFALVLNVTPGPYQRASGRTNSAGFETLARSSGATIRTDLFEFHPGADFRSQVERARAAGIDGVFLLPSRLGEEAIRLDEAFVAACREHELPVVLIERNLAGRQRELTCDLVSMDDLAGGRALTRHLIEQGRRKIAFVLGSLSSSHLDRQAGYLCEMAGAGLAPTLLTQATPELTRETYLALADQLDNAQADAVIGYCDYLSLGLVIELLRRGVAIPGRIALAGFDNIDIGQGFSVGLTTYECPSDAIAVEARRLVQRRRATPDAPPLHVSVPGKLIVRNSTEQP
jgi:LacI family transcriptional regulator